MTTSLTIHLRNSSGDEVYAYVTGLDLDKNGARVLLAADGRTLYHPANPPSDAWLQPLGEDVAIPLRRDGAHVAVEVPHIAGGRIWFSRGPKKLTFLLNPSFNDALGAALVEPSVLNPADPNAAVDFSFCEFTFDAHQLYANITYVDFVPRLPIALTLQGVSDVQHVTGMQAEAFERVCREMCAQTGRDGWPWDKLVVREPGSGPDAPSLRVLSPTHAKSVGASFDGYFEKYVDDVWEYYRDGGGGHTLYIDTQTGNGIVFGRVDKTGQLFTFARKSLPNTFPDLDQEAFAKPTTADIMTCASGPFAMWPQPLRNAVVPRLSAAIHRSTLLTSTDQPCANQSKFYQGDPTNHYSRIVHAANLDGKGYAFPYDDVQPESAPDQSGKVNSRHPLHLEVSVGGKDADAGAGPP